LAPRINAAGRLHRADAGLELMLTGDADRARAIAEELDALNHERRDVETRIRFEADAMARELGPDVPAYVLAGEGWHPGVIGIVASRVAERYHRPAVLIALDGDEGTGSGRSIPGFDLLGGLTAASDELLRYGGHRAAAGLTIARNRVDAFREAFCAHAAAVLRPEDLVRRERIDAVVAGSALDLGLAEELERLEPVGCGNPPVSLLVPAALCDDPRPMGEGRHVAFTLAAGGARSRCVSFGRGTSLPAEPGCPVDAAVRLEVNRYNGSVEPRLVLRHAAAPSPAPIEILGEPAAFADGLRGELDRDLAAPAATSDVDDLAAWAAAGRAVHDARGTGIVGLIAELVATGDPVLVLAAHAPHRARALRERVGGFALASYAALADEPGLAAPFVHVVALDPPPHPVAPAGAGHTHLAWGEPELGFARRIHQWDYALRDPLATVYRALRAQGGAGGEALEAILRGDGPQPRSAALAGRLVRVLAELGLVHLDRAGPALTVAEAPARTALEHSAAFRAYQARLEDGLRFLKTHSTGEATQAA
ncbi:MAG TPA: DHHA1 domain-containing protein, partial [Solirubrobacteraceae bacterium]